MVFERFGGQSGAKGQNFEDICDASWRLLERLLIHMLTKWEVLGMPLGVLGGRFSFDFGSKIDVNTGIADLPESTLSLAREHRFWRSEGCFFGRFCVVRDGL